jgi:hypothetical protein
MLLSGDVVMHVAYAAAALTARVTGIALAWRL